MRIITTILSWLLSLVLVAVLAFIIVMVLAGPHAGLLPAWLEAVILTLGWLAVLVCPCMVARKVWSRLGTSKSGNKAVQ